MVYIYILHIAIQAKCKYKAFVLTERQAQPEWGQVASVDKTFNRQTNIYTYIICKYV